MPAPALHYRVPVTGGGECDNTPRIAVFVVDAALAQEIATLSGLAKTHSLHRLEKFDYRAEFLQHDPLVEEDEADDLGDANVVATENDLLVVTKEEFFFRAYIKHTEALVTSERKPIAELLTHFGLAQVA